MKETSINTDKIKRCLFPALLYFSGYGCRSATKKFSSTLIRIKSINAIDTDLLLNVAILFIHISMSMTVRIRGEIVYGLSVIS